MCLIQKYSYGPSEVDASLQLLCPRCEGRCSCKQCIRQTANKLSAAVAEAASSVASLSSLPALTDVSQLPAMRLVGPFVILPLPYYDALIRCMEQFQQRPL